jgi:hypothetical protein
LLKGDKKKNPGYTVLINTQVLLKGDQKKWLKETCFERGIKEL